jgi:hypothetical protein
MSEQSNPLIRSSNIPVQLEDRLPDQMGWVSLKTRDYVFLTPLDGARLGGLFGAVFGVPIDTRSTRSFPRTLSVLLLKPSRMFSLP